MVFRKKYLLAVRYLLIELLLDRTNYFNLSFDYLFVKIFALGRGDSSFFGHAEAKLLRKHWTLIEN